MTVLAAPEQSRLLTQILDSVRSVAADGKTPVLVLDLDHTLFDNGPRTIAILRMFARETGRTALYERLMALPERHQPYLISDILARVDEHDKAVASEAFGYWRDRFFYDEHIHHDIPMEGAASFCTEAFEAGATLVYLTGRDSPNMLVGTTISLRTHGYPVGVAHTVMVLKPAFEIPDLEFKTDAVSFIRTLGHVVASFDNEPGNCNLFGREFPECDSVFLDTAMAPGAPPLDDGIPSMTNFQR
ncbi:MAG: hypothetical protein ACI9WU_003045 [Myxococcota bacterium]|jgi:hypothetical protein